MRQRRVAAHEHHGELVVAQRLLTHVGLRGRAFENVQLAAERDVAPDEIEGAMPGDLEKPRPWLGGHAAEGPALENQRILHGLFREVEPRRSKPAREPRHHLSRAVAEQVLDERVDVGRRGHVHPRRYMSQIWRTSRLPASRCGWSLRKASTSS